MTTGLWELVGAVVAFVLSAVIGRFLIPILHKLKYGQTILDIGPSWHKKKQGTPTMGGIMFIIGIVVATVIAIPCLSIFGDIYEPTGYSYNNYTDNVVDNCKVAHMNSTCKRNTWVIQVHCS